MSGRPHPAWDDHLGGREQETGITVEIDTERVLKGETKRERDGRGPRHGSGGSGGFNGAWMELEGAVTSSN